MEVIDLQKMMLNSAATAFHDHVKSDLRIAYPNATDAELDAMIDIGMEELAAQKNRPKAVEG